MKNYKSIISGGVIFSLFALPLVLTSCKQNDDFFAQEYRLAPEGFGVIGDDITTNDNVNFETGNSSISGTFTHPVSWTVTIKGTESGAVKTITGLSQDLNVNWNGNHDGLYFFKAGEQVEVTVSFLGTNKVVKDTITIVKVKKYNSQGFVIGDDPNISTLEGFESTGTTFSLKNSYWDNYPDSGELVYLNRDVMSGSEKVVQGNYALTIQGNDKAVGGSPYFVGGLKRIITSGDYSKFPANLDPKTVYLNIYLFGRGDSFTKLNYSVEESDGGLYEKQLSFDHVGWKLFSIRYADLVEIQKGNTVREPNKVRFVYFNLISAPSGNSVKATFDFPIITFGAPFDPGK